MLYAAQDQAPSIEGKETPYRTLNPFSTLSPSPPPQNELITINREHFSNAASLAQQWGSVAIINTGRQMSAEA